MIVKRIGDATLYLANNADVFDMIENVDVTITDPPYDKVTHVGARSANSLNKSKIDFREIEEFDFIEMSKKLLSITKRWVVMTCDWRHASAIEEKGLPLIRLGVWVKPNAAPQFTGDRPGTGWEAVALLHNKGKKRWNGGGHHAVWNFPIEQGEHPTQKPLRLLNKFVIDFTEPEEVVFDPYMGSGTTGVAAIQMGRKFIGIEKDEKYFDLACKRLEAASRQNDLIGFQQHQKQSEIFYDD